LPGIYYNPRLAVKTERDGEIKVAKYVSWLPHHSIGDTIQWLKEIEWKQDEDGNIAQNDNYIWGFVLRETSELFGSGGLICLL